MNESRDLSAVHADWVQIKTNLDLNPLYALSVYKNAIRVAKSSLVRERLGHVFSDPLSFAVAGKNIQPADMADDLPQKYRDGRSRDRRRLVTSIVDRLFECGIAAQNGQEPERDLLAGVGATFERLVLTGTLDQQFACKIAVELGKKKSLPEPLRTLICERLITALVTVLRVGAPTTRDSAVEGLGALLKCFPDREAHFQVRALAEADMAKGDRSINTEYFGRLERRREMVLAVADAPARRTKYLKELEQTLDEVEYPGFPKLESALTECADRLRGVTAICRQAAEADQQELNGCSIALLLRAARLLRIDEHEDLSTQAAFARYQESVFHTISIFADRGADPEAFDDVIAAAIDAIPKTLIGEAPLCNGQTRAAVAVISCGSNLLRQTYTRTTAKAFQRLFTELRKPASLWSNPGIVEGCYRSLPALLENPRYNDWTMPVLKDLFTYLEAPHDFDDLVETHRQILSATCFRRILISLAESAHDQFLEAEADERRHASEVDFQVRTLLANADAEHVREVLQRAPRKTSGPLPHDVAAGVINATMFERELLSRSGVLLSRWKTFLPPQQLLLTRILATQLHVLSHDIKEVRSIDLLAQLYDGMATITFTETERQRRVWELLADVSPEPARAADADLQDFVEHAGIRRSTNRKANQPHDDLPGYVLAMIDDSASERIAAAIAREIDLNVRHERLSDSAFDLAEPLYQVTLRGPHESIFDHLFPRMESDADRDVVLLFRKHVARIRACAEKRGASAIVDIADLLDHIKDIVRDLHRRRRAAKYPASATLNHLEQILKQFRVLTADNTRIWDRLVKEPGAVATLFERLDSIADRTSAVRGPASPGEPHANRREHLLPGYGDALSELRATVQDYLDCAINDMGPRERALQRASTIVGDIERRLVGEIGLQPPERVMLVALMQYYRSVFQRAIQWHCEEPRRYIEALDYDGFWKLFATGRQRSELSLRLQREEKFVRRDYGEMFTETFVDARILERGRRLEAAAGKEPPRFRKQREKFEAFFVEWTSGELEVAHLRAALEDRWPTWFDEAHKAMTNLDMVGMIIIVPFVVAAIFDALGVEALEGFGFFVLAAGFISLAVMSFAPTLHALISRVRRSLRKEIDEDRRPQYRFHSFLPRLARLIAVPIALLVDFEHSYEFPMKASSWSLLLLMTLAYLTTRFFVQREIVDREGRTPIPDPEISQPKMRTIVAVAIAHAFGIATLFSVMFAGSQLGHQKSDATGVRAPSLYEVMNWAGEQKWAAAAKGFADWTVNRFEAVPDHHRWPLFLGIIPRDVSFDGGKLLPFLPQSIRNHLLVTYYPTLILTWTAMGLFFGVFLEGFLNGERLRGEIRQKPGESRPK